MALDDWRRFGQYPPRSRTRQAEGGIRASAQRGSFAQTWWARRWIEVLETFEIGGRLQRGRSYARKGQVLSIDVGKGVVKARVQGSRPTPYESTIRVTVLKPAEWKRLADQLSTQAIFAARLLAGEMPQDIEAAFTAAGLSLFPSKASELKTDCSCPDWSNPCKHVTAVCYLLGEAFDRDPFLMFRLRGIERDELMPMLGHAPQGEADVEPEPPPEPLSADPEEFWRIGAVPADLLADLDTPRPAAALPKRLGNLQFWRGVQPLPVALEPTYERAKQKALSLLLGESADLS